MPTLYEADRHEPVTEVEWDAAVAQDCVAAIVRDAVARYSPLEKWPSHPLESFAPDVRWNLYIGAAGAMWALHHLASLGCQIELPDFAADVASLFGPNRAWIRDIKAPNEPHYTNGLLCGDVGILLVQARLNHLNGVAAQIAVAVDANQDNPVREFMWGSPGTALACLWLHDWTGEEIWAAKFRRDVELLWRRLEHCDAAGCDLWVQSLYGHEAPHLGAAHGFAGNAFPVIKGWHLLRPDEQSRWADRLAESLRRTAIWGDGCANWPQSVGRHRPGRTALLVQHCHGAPGIVTCFAEFPDPAIDDLLLAAGEMTWRAGPLCKGSGLCHGTAGNGYAFLKLFRRTGDRRWLERARRFAMHAIGQYERDLQAYGQARYTLWTGDLGLAIYLSNCMAATDRFPTMDVF